MLWYNPCEKIGILETMPHKPYINILVAEDNVLSREMMAALLVAQGFNPIHAANGDEAIAAVTASDIDLAIVDVNMTPTGGFEFMKHLLVKGIDIPVVIVTADDSSDLLIEASALGVRRLLQKPIQPKRLIDTVLHILRQRGINPQPLAVETHVSAFSHTDLMKRAIMLAERNHQSGKGGPYGAVVANEKGEILGEGVNGITARSDPTAHAEVMAIRQAAEKLNRSDLKDCILYSSSEPTMMGKALIISVGLQKVYYGLSHDEIKTLRTKEDRVRQEMSGSQAAQTSYEQLGHEEAMDMFQNCLAASKDSLKD